MIKRWAKGGIKYRGGLKTGPEKGITPLSVEYHGTAKKKNGERGGELEGRERGSSSSQHEEVQGGEFRKLQKNEDANLKRKEIKKSHFQPRVIGL